MGGRGGHANGADEHLAEGDDEDGCCQDRIRRRVSTAPGIGDEDEKSTSSDNYSERHFGGRARCTIPESAPQVDDRQAHERKKGRIQGLGPCRRNLKAEDVPVEPEVGVHRENAIDLIGHRLESAGREENGKEANHGALFGGSHRR